MDQRAPENVARRYDRLAPVYRVIELVFGLPPGIRRHAVEQLGLRRGGTVMEIGCGSGRNLEHLVRAVDPGRVIGVDVSAGMLRRAEALCRRRGWTEVSLLREDAGSVDLPPGLDGILFGLSYSVLPDRHATLLRAWEALAPGGRVVILDAALPPGRLGQMLRPVMRAVSRATVLGDPESRPWEELAAVAGTVHVERFRLGTYVVCSATQTSADEQARTQGS